MTIKLQVRLLTRILAFALIAAGALTATAKPAAAADYYASRITPGMNVRVCADPGCQVATSTTTTGRMQCWRDGGMATGKYSSKRWFLMELNNGQEGYVHSSFVTNQVTVPNCGTIPRVLAADWALGQVGNGFAPAEYGNGVWGMDWNPGPSREWAGDCAKLPFIAYKRQGLNYPLGNAANSYYAEWETLGRMGMQRTATLPRYGDPVYYSLNQPSSAGHTAIYVGGLLVVGTQGMDFAKDAAGNPLPVAVYSIDRYPGRLGWAKFSAS